MSVLKGLTDWLNTNFPLSDFGIDQIQYEEMTGSSVARCAIYATGGAERDLYIGGDKEVDFGFKIMYHCISEDTNSRVVANNFFAALGFWLWERSISGLAGLDIGEGNAPKKIVMQPQSKTETKQDNSQVWVASFTLTYEKRGV